jgi:formylglycine-generating enzyme required for sulfatase activity
MGVSEIQANRSELRERPPREVWLSAYKIGGHPVTVSTWFHFIRDTGFVWPEQEWSRACDKELGARPGGDQPITFVSWNDADEFTRWGRRESGLALSLPTEAQWERACRGAAGGLYPWSASEPDWAEELKRYDSKVMLHSVGSLRDHQSSTGCDDMWCSVSEWCADAYDESDEEYRPTGKDPMRTPTPSLPLRAIRGGNWWDRGWPRCSCRAFLDAHARNVVLGFRLVVNAR